MFDQCIYILFSVLIEHFGGFVCRCNWWGWDHLFYIFAYEEENYRFFHSFHYIIGSICCFCLLEWEYSSWYFSALLFPILTLFHMKVGHWCYCLLLCSNNAGAKEAHGVSPHFAQIMYFSLFSALLMAPLYFNFGQAVDLFHTIWRNRPLSFFQLLVAFIGSFISVHFFRSGPFYVVLNLSGFGCLITSATDFTVLKRILAFYLLICNGPWFSYLNAFFVTSAPLVGSQM